MAVTQGRKDQSTGINAGGLSQKGASPAPAGRTTAFEEELDILAHQSISIKLDKKIIS
jgi:hypothetical protein